MKHIRVHEYVEKHRIALNRGETLLVELAENPTTGYRWHVEELNGNYIELNDTNFSPANQADDAEGSAGLRSFTFKASGLGKTMLVLANKQP